MSCEDALRCPGIIDDGSNPLNSGRTGVRNAVSPEADVWTIFRVWALTQPDVFGATQSTFKAMEGTP